MPALPVGPRKTMGTGNCPPDMDIIFAAELITWSMATSEKLNVIYSTIGRQPVIVDPIAIPENPASAIVAKKAIDLLTNEQAAPLNLKKAKK